MSNLKAVTQEKRIFQSLKKYKYAIAVILAGVVLMLLPKCQSSGETQTTDALNSDTFSIEQQEQKLSDVLGKISGVGKVQVMLTLKSGTQLHLAEDAQTDGDAESRSETVTISRGSGQQDIVVTGRLYPTYQGALIVCEGADDPSVQLAITTSVSALTGLSAGKISVVRWNS